MVTELAGVQDADKIKNDSMWGEGRNQEGPVQETERAFQGVTALRSVTEPDAVSWHDDKLHHQNRRLFVKPVDIITVYCRKL